MRFRFVIMSQKMLVGTLVTFIVVQLLWWTYSNLPRSYSKNEGSISWDGVPTHSDSLVDWDHVQQVGSLNKTVDWSMVKRRPKPAEGEMHDKWIVVTSINSPTTDLKKLTKIKGWKLLVVGDTKTPADWSLPGAVYLGVQAQEELGYRTVKVMPYKNYGRKNIGYLYAIEHGAKMIYETDDDTSPYENKIKFFQAGTGDFLVYNTNRHVVNPYAHFGQATTWPRGYPLEEIAHPPQHSFVKCSNVKAVVQQGVVDGDPDVDAVFRLTRKDDGVQLDLKFDPRAPPILIPPGTYTSYNCQNTLHLYDAFWGMILPPGVTFRVTDIWRAYFTQRLLQEVNGYLGYFGPSAYQLRSPHSYLKDFIEEQDLYYKSGHFIKYLEQWKAGDVDFFNSAQRLAVDLVYQDIWRPLDAVAVNAWLEDLTSFGYQPPPLKKTVKPCAVVIEAVKERKFQQHASSYLRLGKEMRQIMNNTFLHHIV